MEPFWLLAILQSEIGEPVLTHAAIVTEPEKLKVASLGKKRAAVKNLRLKSRDPKNLYYLDPEDPALSRLVSGS